MLRIYSTSKHILIILIALALSGCAVVTWKHPTKGYGKISTMSTKGSAEFMLDYHGCEEIAMRHAKDQDKCNDPCLVAREHTRCMKEEHGWKIDENADQ